MEMKAAAMTTQLTLEECGFELSSTDVCAVFDRGWPSAGTEGRRSALISALYSGNLSPVVLVSAGVLKQTLRENLSLGGVENHTWIFDFPGGRDP